MTRDDGPLDLSPLRPAPRRVQRLVGDTMAGLGPRWPVAALWEDAITDLARWWLPALLAAGIGLAVFWPGRRVPAWPPPPHAAAQLGPVIGVPVAVSQWAAATTPPPTAVMLGQLGVSLGGP